MATLRLLIGLLRHGRRVTGGYEMLAVQICDEIDIEKKIEVCLSQVENVTSGCMSTWDVIACWPSAKVGEVVTIPCPDYFSFVSDQHRGNISKTCTSEGWTEINPFAVALNCGYNPNSTTGEDVGDFLWSVKIGYTIGHTVSLISLIVAIIILCNFRKLHCTRNYIHIHLFLSFIVKAVAVLVKDMVLFDDEECKSESVGCKAAVVFFQYGVMASFFWLLVEGLYLHALLAVSFFSEKKYFWWYILIGWGVPATFITAWSITKAYLNDVGCWDLIDDDLWWIIKTPILMTVLVTFILFICIIRILQQKINCRDIGRNESNQYSRLAKSTLLLIPLFGINYIIFAFIPEDMGRIVRLVFDLILGSFQGFVVAVLYCFLNGEVQSEIKRKWRRWHLQRFLGNDTKYQQPSMASNGNNFSTQITMLTKCSPTTRRASACLDDLSAI
ncbi:vasoactive intestinal polypeptide receptor isoform X2 [Denticeps clupeoides]|uniref:vasoactive intestinal polypeptide receptor isoform X2 n=1 Tax=Denticeps clupeoides TaxID=299321 RepID=UPI0010A30EDF|nr:vasoactive intestinal polypeptide receptor-like isoform X2 [Denticeps clupeoides]